MTAEAGGSTGAPPQRGPARGLEITASGLRKRVPGGRCVLHDVSLAVGAGEVVAIVGGSGAGKTTLLEALAGVRPAEEGRVLFDGVDVYRNLDAFRTVLGYVPQDDIIHTELPLDRTLRYAARLRLPGSSSWADVDAAVARALDVLGLSDRAAVRVGALSGGQRTRASIAVEMLTEPRVFFLDEPTSGLDPSTAAELMRALRRLAGTGSTVVLTTHAVQDLGQCDRVAFLARDGHLAFVGTPEEACAYFDVPDVERVYERLAGGPGPEGWGRRFAEHRRSLEPDGPATAGGEAGGSVAPRPRAGFARQWSVLSRRTLETLARNRLTMAILLGSPALVVAMFAILFRPGAFDFADPNPSAITMILFWVTFGGFFFGLTYGLLQICTERAIVRREYLVGQRLGAYLSSKVTILVPFLVLVVALMLGVLRGLDRLPPAGMATYLSVGVTLTLVSAAALTLGLLTSAAVANPAQATLALPMLCFPAVLFSGAILPVNVMATAGAVISAAMPNRWAFEAVGRDLEVRHLLEHGGSPLGPPLLEAYGDAGLRSTGTYWLYLAGFTVAFLVAAWAVLERRCRRDTR